MSRLSAPLFALALIAGRAAAGAPAVTLSPELPVDAPVPAAAAAQQPAIAFNGSEHLAAWIEGTTLRASRLDAAGAALDFPGLLLAGDSSRPGAVRMASDGAGFLVVWTALGYDHYRVEARYVGADGTVSPLLTAGDVSANNSTPWVAFAGSTFLVAWQSGAQLLGQRFGATGPIDAAPAVLATGFGYALGSNGTSFLLSYLGSGNTPTARLIGAQPGPEVAIGPALQFGAITSVASDGTGFLVTWYDQTGVRARRLGADGVPVDTTTYSVSSLANATNPAAAALGGGGYLVVWQRQLPGDYNSSFLRYATIDSSGALSLEAELSNPRSTYSYEAALAPTLGGGLLLAFGETFPAQRIAGVHFDAFGALLDLAPGTLAFAPATESAPVVADDGQHYLAAWIDARDGAPAIYAARLTHGGAPVAASPFLVASGVGQNVARTLAAGFDGINFQLLWISAIPGASGQAVHRARVSPGGTVLADEVLASTAASADACSIYYTSLACSGAACYATWHDFGCSGNDSVHGRLLPSDGTLGADTAVIDHPHPSAGALASDGSGFVAVKLAFDPGQRSYNLVGVAISASGSASAPKVLEPGGFYFQPSLAFGGGQYLLAYDDSHSGGSIRAARFSPSLSPIGAAFRVSGTNGNGQQFVSAYDGAQFALGWVDMTGFVTQTSPFGPQTHSVWSSLLSFIATDGSLITAAPVTLASRYDSPSAMALASARKGSTILVYDGFDSALAVQRVKARLAGFGAPLGTACQADTDCGSGLCAGGFCCGTSCGGCGSCQTGACLPSAAGTAGACGDYLCDGTSASCPSSCNADNACVSADYCNPANQCAYDNVAPVVSLTVPARTEATGPSGAPVAYAASAVDNKDGTRATTCSLASGIVFPVGSTPVTCTASDANGNLGSATRSVIVVDSTPPSFAVPQAFTREAAGPDGAVVTYSASATDLVDGQVGVSCSPASGATFPIATTLVGCSAADSHGNGASTSFAVTVRDSTPPTLVVPASFSFEATGPQTAVPFAASATDLVDGAIAPACSPASGAIFPLDVATQVSCSATDAHGNPAAASFAITVTDTTAPALSLPRDQVATATSVHGAQVSFTAGASDLVDGAVPVSCTPASGSVFPLGPTTVTCTAADAHRNTATGHFTVTVNPGCLDLGQAAPFNVFAGGDFTVQWSQVQGAVAARGSFTAQGYSVGGSLPRGATALVAGGDATLNSGSIGGDSYAAGATRFSSYGQSGQQHGAPLPVDFAAADASLKSLSAVLAEKAPTGTTSLQYGGITLTGWDAKLNVFSVPAAALATAWGVTITVPSTSQVLINVTGAGAQQIANMGWNTAPLPRGRILLNLPGATSLGLRGIGLDASILAPSADLKFDSGNLNGQIVAKSFAGQGAVNLGALSSCVAIP